MQNETITVLTTPDPNTPSTNITTDLPITTLDANALVYTYTQRVLLVNYNYMET